VLAFADYGEDCKFHLSCHWRCR